MIRRLALCCVALFCYSALAESQFAITSDCAAFPNAVVGSMFSQSLNTQGCIPTQIGGQGNQCSVQWGVTTGALPPGLTLAANPTRQEVGIISGIPSMAGTYTFTITATDMGGGGATDTLDCTIHVVVNSGGVPPQYSLPGNNMATYLVGHNSGRDSGSDGGTSCAISAAAPLTGGLALGAALLAGAALFIRRFLK